jgi:outer membrane protein assembly factor BamB
LLQYDGWIVKLAADGNVAWQRRFEGPSNNGGLIRSASPTADGGTLVVGELNNNAFLMRLDAAGETVLQRAYGGGQYDYALSGVETADGGYILTANSASFYLNAPVHTDIWTLKVEAPADITFLPPPPNISMTIPAVTGVLVDVPVEHLNPGSPWVQTGTTAATTAVSSDVTLTAITRSQ